MEYRQTFLQPASWLVESISYICFGIFAGIKVFWKFGWSPVFLYYFLLLPEAENRAWEWRTPGLPGESSLFEDQTLCPQRRVNKWHVNWGRWCQYHYLSEDETSYDPGNRPCLTSTGLEKTLGPLLCLENGFKLTLYHIDFFYLYVSIINTLWRVGKVLVINTLFSWYTFAGDLYFHCNYWHHYHDLIYH